MTVLEKKVLSSDGLHMLAGKVYLPEIAPIGYLQIVHGMTEYIGRYDGFMRLMAQAGYICFGYDHLGHGHTVNDESEFGFIAKKDGYQLLIKDVSVFATAVQAEYGNLPYYLMGHSMGSFIVRCAVAQGLRPDKLIVMGTGGPNPAAIPGLMLVRIIRAIHGDRHISPLLQKLAFGSYNSRFPKDSPYHWLTKDAQIKQAYAADRFCTFYFTTSAMQDLMTLLKNANSAPFYTGVGTQMPVLLVSGTDDPVGNYGAGVKQVYQKLQAAKAQVIMYLYDDCRHEILNDTCREQVIQDILQFLQ